MPEHIPYYESWLEGAFGIEKSIHPSGDARKRLVNYQDAIVYFTSENYYHQFLPHYPDALDTHTTNLLNGGLSHNE